MINQTELLEFRRLSARLGENPLLIQAAGGNTSIKDGSRMLVKASGTELANAMSDEIFVEVDRQAALMSLRSNGQGAAPSDGGLVDPSSKLRPSIETTFHAAIDHPVVVHTHSINALAHLITSEGSKVATEKLSGLKAVLVPFAKPGIPLTKVILEAMTNETRVILLRNHGLICCGSSVQEVSLLIDEVESRLALTPRNTKLPNLSHEAPPDGFDWASEESWMAFDERIAEQVSTGAYYPDHVVFLGGGLRDWLPHTLAPTALLRGEGVLIKNDATAAQRKMLRCLSDVFARLPAEWSPQTLSATMVAELTDWDAEKYRQSLAKSNA